DRGSHRDHAELPDPPRAHRSVKLGRLHEGGDELPGDVLHPGDVVAAEVRVHDPTLIVELDSFEEGDAHPHHETSVELHPEQEWVDRLTDVEDLDGLLNLD